MPEQGIVDPIGMREFAYEMLLELKHRSSQKDFALEHMQDLLDSALDAGDIDLARKIMIPEFSAAYRRSCEVVPSAVVAKSLRAATGFAAHDKQIWRQTKGIETIPHIYRIRVGIHHRLMIQWNKEKGLKVLDLIPRAQLETWIRRHAA
ncbi:MAG: hypothetical protein PVH42_15210 [Desulfobacterales bacterium]|jgi:hypothetical protein